MSEVIIPTPEPQETPVQPQPINLADPNANPAPPTRTLDQCRDIVYEALSGKKRHTVELVMECIVQLQSKLNKDLKFYFLEAVTQGGVFRGTAALNPIRFRDPNDDRVGLFCTLAAMCMIANQPSLGSNVDELKKQCKAKFPFAGDKNFDQAIDIFPPFIYARYHKIAEDLNKKYGNYMNPLMGPNGLTKTTGDFRLRYLAVGSDPALAKDLAIDIAKSFGPDLFKLCPPSGTETRKKNQTKILDIIARCGENAAPITLDDYDAKTIEAADYYFRFAMWTDLQARFEFIVVSRVKGVFTTESFDLAEKEYEVARNTGGDVNMVQFSLEICATFSKYVPRFVEPIAKASELLGFPEVNIHPFWLTNAANNHKIFPFDPKRPDPIFYIGHHDYRIASLLYNDSPSRQAIPNDPSPKHMYFYGGGYDQAQAVLRRKFPEAIIGRYVHGNDRYPGGNLWQSRPFSNVAEDEHTQSKSPLYWDIVEMQAQGCCPLTACGVLLAKDVPFSNDRTGKDVDHFTFTYMAAHRGFGHGNNPDVPIHELTPQGELLKEMIQGYSADVKNGWSQVKKMKAEKGDKNLIFQTEKQMKTMSSEEKKLKEKVYSKISSRAREAYEEEIYGKMLTFFGSQILAGPAGTDVVIMGMIGMGAFGNEPEPMVRGMQKALQALMNSPNKLINDRLPKMTIVWVVDPTSENDNTRRFATAVQKMLEELGHEVSESIVPQSPLEIKVQ